MPTLRAHSFRFTFADQAGFTINELIVAMVVGSILVGYAFELYVFASRIVSAWRAKTGISTAAERVLGQMTLDLQRSSSLIQEGDSVFVMASDNREIASYHVSHGVVSRNGVAMHPQEKIQVAVRANRSGSSVDLDVRAASGKGEVLLRGTAVLQMSSTSRVMGAGRGGENGHGIR